MNRTVLFAALTVAPLAACAPPPPPTVTAFNGSSVEIQSIPGQFLPNVQTNGEADRICSKAGRYAEYASSRDVTAGHSHLYLCLERATQTMPYAAAPQPQQQAIYPAQPFVVIR